ncbi:MAG TPA: toxin-antitoxin system HicB family antitoxin [Thermoanaerobaculia bacterium]|nr:toxin-antitoxin system HicB family antitoxin [Thermoanaerobaculia bacterium]
MGALSLRLPESLHQKLGELAEREGISINQLITSAVAEKMSALMTEEYLTTRAKRASRRKFEAALAKVPDVEPEEFDRLPGKAVRRNRSPKRAG